MLAAVVEKLRREASETNERRLLVLAGAPDATRSVVGEVLRAADIDLAETTLVGPEPILPCEHLTTERSGQLLGTTRNGIVLDLYASCDPNAIGRAVGAVDGGGLLVLLVPPLADWPARRDEFDEFLAVPPAAIEDVTGNFRTRLVELLRVHPGVAIVDVDTGTVERNGLTHPSPRLHSEPPTPTAKAKANCAFPAAAYDACRTEDQVSAVHALECLRQTGKAAVVEANRGRGKSSAAGLAAGALALEGKDVLVVAPQYRSAAEVFARARELLTAQDALTGTDDTEPPHVLRTEQGRVRFECALKATDLPDDPDTVIVDEAAALPVCVLEAYLEAPSVGFATTIHGYEGAGRGFSVRFRDRLTESDHDVTEVTLTEPIRYAGGDPVEVWAFRALLLDARPPVEPLVADATTDTVTYTSPSPTDLLADEHLLREVFGLLVFAHYRTEPTDLARLLDAPNITVRALLQDGHVVSVALLAREGGLSAATREHMYDGGRVAGNMLPDVLTTQLRDESAGIPVGLRVLRIATHHAARSRGLGSRLLSEIRAEFTDDVDWLGVGYGATPDLIQFWDRNGYEPVHFSMTRNETSGENSVLMLTPTSDTGRDLRDRHAEQFVSRIGGVLADTLNDADPDVVRALLGSINRNQKLDLADWEWRHVASAAFGPGLFDMAPGLYRDLALAAFASGVAADLTDREQRALVLKALQGHPWDTVADRLDYPSDAEAMRAFGDAIEPLVDEFGTDAAQQEADRYR